MRTFFLLAFLLQAQSPLDLRRAKEPVKLGLGLEEAPRLPHMAIEASVNLAFITHRVQPPAGPGDCMPNGTGVWAADRSYLYVCVPNETRTSFVWARVPLAVW